MYIHINAQTHIHAYTCMYIFTHTYIMNFTTLAVSSRVFKLFKHRFNDSGFDMPFSSDTTLSISNPRTFRKSSTPTITMLIYIIYISIRELFG